ncbi:MAG: DPP IV N-terminal domain-containing protein, partial [Bacteroidales bacterium]|nr:DPP IV N-terminal domain-containing protein [Bacteroidales bacterium]
MRKSISIVFTIILMLGVLPGFSQEVKKVTLEDVWKNYTFSARSVRGLSSMNDGIHYTTLERTKDGQSIVKYSYQTGEAVDTVLVVRNIEGVKIDMIESYEFSADESQVLLMTNSEPIYRRSFTANYYIYNRGNNQAKSLSENGKQQLATYSPNGRKIAFIRNNNLFYVDLATAKEVQFTFDGEFNKIINGAPDWVYEEEFEFNQAFEWSADSRK